MSGVRFPPGIPTQNLMEILFWLFVKHFICDFPLQAFPYQYKNKGTYFHPGGMLHAAIHFYATFLVLIVFHQSFSVAGSLATLDYVLHYHIDWAKMNLGKRYNLTPTNSEWFWILLGLDQFLHACTYFLIVALL